MHGWMRWLRIAVTALTIGVLFHKYPPSEVVAIVRTVGAPLFATVVVVYFGALALMTWKWALLLPGVPMRTLAHCTLAACFYALLPGGQLGGEIAKALVVRARHPTVPGVVSSILLDKVTGLLGLLFVAVCALTLSSATVPFWEYMVIAGGTAACMGSVVFARPLAALLSRWQPASPRLAHAWAGLLDALREVGAFAGNHRGLATTLVLGFAGQAVAVGCYLLFAPALGIHLPAETLAGAVAVANLTALVPISIAGFGVREAGLVFLLTTQHHVPGAQAFALSLTAMALFLVPALVGGALELRKLAARGAAVR